MTVTRMMKVMVEGNVIVVVTNEPPLYSSHCYLDRCLYVPVSGVVFLECDGRKDGYMGRQNR